MSRVLSIVAICLIGISLSMFFFHKRSNGFDHDPESEENHEKLPVTSLSINSSIPFSNALTNYMNIGICNQAGAIGCVVGSRTESNLVLAGANNGGVWISHNAARTWQPVSDSAGTLCVTSIAQNPFRAN